MVTDLQFFLNINEKKELNELVVKEAFTNINYNKLKEIFEK